MPGLCRFLQDQPLSVQPKAVNKDCGGSFTFSGATTYEFELTINGVNALTADGCLAYW